MTLRQIPAGAVIERVYFWVPHGYAVGRAFEDWTEAIEHAQARLDLLGTSFSDPHLYVSLRWVVSNPNGGPSMDVVVESYAVIGQSKDKA